MNLRILGDGTFNPCCVTFSPYRDETGRPYLADRDSISSVWNSEHARRLRDDLSNGRRPSECRACWETEDKGLKSYRQLMVEQGHGIDPVNPVARDQVEFLIVRYGNICNLKCRICEPISSSKWIQEHNFYTGTDWLHLKQKEMAAEGNVVERRKIMNWYAGNDGFWQELRQLLPGIKKLQISGGEPFLVEEKIELLRECVDSGHSSHIELSILTNGTVTDRKMIEHLLPRFKSMCLSFSIDGIGKHFEYLRHGADWSVVDANLRHAASIADGTSLTAIAAMTLGSMNMLYLPEYGDYFNEIGMEVQLAPTYDKPYMEMTILPLSVRSQIAQRIRSVDRSRLACYTMGMPVDTILDMLESPSAHEDLDLFITETNRVDLYRGESFADTFEELHQMISGIRP